MPAFMPNDAVTNILAVLLYKNKCGSLVKSLSPKDSGQLFQGNHCVPAFASKSEVKPNFESLI